MNKKKFLTSLNRYKSLKYPFCSIFSLLLILSFSACGSQPETTENTAAIETEITESVDEIPLEETSSMNELPFWVFESTPKNGTPRFVVFATRRADREEELEIAQQLAALEVAKYQGIYVSIKELSQKGNANFGYAQDLNIDYKEEEAPQYMDGLEVEKKLRTPEGTFVRFLYNDLSSSVHYTITPDDPPAWTQTTPEIPGYFVAVGFVERHRNWSESFTAADESALSQAAYTLYGKLDNQYETIDQSTSTRGRTGSLGTIYTEGEGIIKNFLVLGHWKDELNNYYSLGVFPQ